MHVVAGAVGIFAFVMASAEAFTLLKLAGAVYLIWLRFKTWHDATIVDPLGVEIVGVGRAYWRGIIVEMLNPKTGAFFSPSLRNS